MNLKNLSPENLVKISASISLLLTQKFTDTEVAIIKNLICSVANNLSAYETQKYLFEKNNPCKK